MKPSRPYHGYTAYHREPGGLRRLDFFVARLEAWRGSRPPSELRILDVGCGNGNIALPIASLGYTVVGLDGDAPSIAHARAQANDLGLKNVEFRQGWMQEVEGQQFDIIIASEVLEHQKDPTAFLAQLKTLLAPNGLLLLSVPNGTSFEEFLRRYSTHTAIGRWLKRCIKKCLRQDTVQSHASHPHEQFFSWPQLTRLLDRSGWGIEASSQAAAVFKEFFYLGGRSFIKRGSDAFQRLDEADARWAKRLPIDMADGWLIECRSIDVTKPLVMHILPTLAGGGAERIVHDLCTRLPDQGFRVVVVSILRGGPLEPAFRSAGIPTIILGKRGWLGRSAVFGLKRLMRERRPAIVHTHLFGADVWGRKAAWLAGVKVRVSTEHNVNTDHGVFRRLIKWLMVPITTRFIAVSQEVKRYMMSEDGIPGKRITVIRNGIDMTRVIARGSESFASPVRLFAAGRLTAQKGYDVLLRALATVGSAWSLDIAGSGEKEGELKGLAERLGLAPRIRWLGQRDDVPALLAKSDVFCFPSRWEGYGLAVGEAAAAGVPIVASDLMAVRETIDHEDATLVAPDDPAALSQAIIATLSDPSRSLARAAALRPRILATCSSDTMAKAYATLYRSLL